MKEFFELFAKNMRSIVAFLVILGGFVYMFLYPDKSKTEVITVMMVVVGYYFTANKDASDKLKADIAQTSSSAVETTITKDKNEPE